MLQSNLLTSSSWWKYVERCWNPHLALHKYSLSKFIFFLVALFLVVGQECTDNICICSKALVVAQVTSENWYLLYMWNNLHFSKYPRSLSYFYNDFSCTVHTWMGWQKGLSEVSSAFLVFLCPSIHCHRFHMGTLSFLLFDDIFVYVTWMPWT